MSQLLELCQFLSISQRPDVKDVALQHILGLTASKEGILAIGAVPQIVACLVRLLSDPLAAVAKDASLALVNLSADPAMAKIMMKSEEIKMVRGLFDIIMNQDSPLADPSSMILSNFTRDPVCCDLVLEQMDQEKIGINQLVSILCQEGYNKCGADLRYLGPVLSNLSQLREGRRRLLDKENDVFQRLLPFTEYHASHVKRGGIVGTIRNCCFEHDHNKWLMGPEVDIVPRLLLPLAGPTPETLDDEEIENLPVDLQYLDEDKKIEEDEDIRKMLIEALTQLCCTKEGRVLLREKNAYVILRELHKIEKNREVLLACENLVDILIKKEQEISIEKYTDVEVPDDVVEKLNEIDKEYLNC